MTNPPVLLEEVSMVRRLLTASDDSDVALVGRLGEIKYIEIATGECELQDYEWMPGDRIMHPEFLRLAADALNAALTCAPGLREEEPARDWVGDWNSRFAAVLQEPEYRR